ncbi:MAG: hypothetical protein KAH86_04870 [Methanosarcinales archaeon]|nr:hypothetical protein [Methanosarcinales archaeon]
MSSTTTIQITTDTRDTLRTIGSMGDDYNTVIEMLITEHNRDKLVEHGKRIVEERKDEFVNLNEL